MNINAIVRLDRIDIFPCDVCSRAFLDKDNLINHTEAGHHIYKNLKMKPQVVLDQLQAYQCQKCHEEFCNLAAFQRHKTMHIKEAEFWKVFRESANGIIKRLKREASGVEVDRESNNPNDQTAPIGKNYVINRNKGSNPETMLKLEPVSNWKKTAIDTYGMDSKSMKIVTTKTTVDLKISNSNETKDSNNKMLKECKPKPKKPKGKTNDEYTCGQCPKSYKTLNEMYKHLISHSEPPNYSEKCSKSSINVIQTKELKLPADKCKMQRNQSFSSGNSSKSISILERSNNLLESIEESKLKHELTYNCNKCFKSFFNSTERNKHLKTHSEGKMTDSYPCEKCQKSFSTKSQMSKHMKTHSDKYKVQCGICSKMFKNKNYLEVHHRVHTGEKPFTCDFCGRKFSQSAALYTHRKIHLGIKDHLCSFCNKAFSEYHNMKNHERTHTKERPFKCQYCGRAFSDPSALKRHERTHTGDKIYSCQECHMKFTDASGLIAHRRRHTGIKDFHCTFCKKKFFTHSELVNHETSVHMCLMSFECDVCKKQFTLKQYLKSHIERNHMESVACEICATKFVSVNELQKHLSKGCVKDKYECMLCGEKFPLKGHVRKHMEQKHFEPLYCNICLHRFYSDYHLQKHKLRGCTKRIYRKDKIEVAKDEI